MLRHLKTNRNRYLLVLGVALLVLLLLRSDFSELSKALGGLTPSALLGLFTLQVITVLLINIQWKAIAQHLGQTIPFTRLLEMNFLGTFFESVTPVVKAGGEVSKVAYLKSQGQALPEGAALLTAQKWFSASTFVVFALFSAAWAAPWLGGPLQSGVWGGLALIGGALVATLAAGIYFYRTQTRGGKVRALLEEFLAVLSKLARRKRRIAAYIVLGFMIWSLYAFKTFYVSDVLGAGLSFAVAGTVTFLAYAVNMLPLSPGGIGTFEGAMAALFVLFGLEYALALSIAFVLRLMTFWAMLGVSALYLGLRHLQREVFT